MRVLAVVLVLMSATLAWADAPPPPEPIPNMEPRKLGPRTEQVDQKAYAKVVRISSGESIADALKGISDAAESKRYAILVAGGEYKGSTVEMKPFVDLFGGFDSTGKRDIEANRTILDGEGQRRVVVGADNARIDGFIVRNGKVRGPGAGVLCDHVAPTISNCTIINNATQEPQGFHQEMYHQHGYDGGGIACITGAHANITNNIIANNKTDIGNGGGIAVANWSMPQITNNVIVNNRTGLKDVKSRSSNGAGISASNAVVRPPLRMRVLNNVIANNYAGGNSDAGGVYCEYDSSPVIAANWILANFAEDDGSGVYIMKLSEPIFVNNIVAGQGKGAIRLSKQGCGELENNLIFGNGNAITSVSAWMNLKNNTIVDNHSGVGHENQYAPYIKPPVVVGNVIYNNGDGVGGGLGIAPGVGNDTPTVKNNDIQGGYKGAGGDSSNFDEKPQFLDDGAKASASSMKVDAERGVTIIAGADLPEPEKLAGRIVSVGDKWGVVKEAAKGKLIVWGDLSGKEASSVTLARTYKLKAPLAQGVGAQASR